MCSRNRLVSVCLVMAVVGLPLQKSTVAQASLRYGAWKLNLAKSTYDPGPAPQSETRTYKASGDGLASTVDRIEADASHTAIHWAAHFDGNDNPYVGSPIYDTIALTKADALNLDAIQKKAAKWSRPSGAS
jgi:hypothetical protein